ncbi:alpha/beta hydrolase [Afipia sp. Root123D2]|uniref:alpha/beta fold hydrolase n=1 Tax=Afipia sp. Root123D2 TaxID=1736436 RepID=UPI0006F1E140|nr:alpha/beta hydrolase [Afipia sp. Root123D2]KQW21890.1 alpha/beta hydrolase [Afipia sp. Root123D2]
MTLTGLATALLLLAVVTQIGVFVLERLYPPRGQFIDVPGARLHVLDIGPRDAPGLPVVLIHGATSSLETMHHPLGEMLAKSHRVILIDRPGVGRSTRDRATDSGLADHSAAINAALVKLGIERAIFVGHSWAGALMPDLALGYPRRVAGVVMLSPVAYPWSGGVGAFNKLATVPILGPVLAYTLPLPLGLFLIQSGINYVFSPQTSPANFWRETQVPLVLRPRTYLNNAWDLVTLKAEVIKQAPHYRDITVPAVVIAGDADRTVSTAIHSRPFAEAVPGAKLIVLPNVGHMPQYAAPDLIVREIETMITKVSSNAAAAAR